MIKRKIAVLLTVLMMYSTTAFGEVMHYGVSTKQNGASVVKDYNVQELTEDFLNAKHGEPCPLYTEFLANLKNGEFVYFQDDKGKSVDYKYIIEQFMDYKRENKSFNLDKVIEEAPDSAVLKSDKKKDDDVVKPDATTGAVTMTEISTTTLTDKEKEKAKEMLKNQQGGKEHQDKLEKERLEKEKLEKEKAKQIADKVQKSLADINMPVMSKEDIKEINNIVTNNNYRDDIWKSLDDYFKETLYVDEGALSSLGYENLSKEDSQSIDTVLRRDAVRKKVQNELSKNPKYANLFDLDNYLKFDNMTIDFSKLNKINHEDFPAREIVCCEDTKKLMSTLGIKDEGLIEKGDGSSWVAQGYPYSPVLSHTFMWKPYMERDFIETINRMRVAKGAKPLEYDVNLHAMARYSVKRSSMGFNHSCISEQYAHFSNKWHYRNWINGAIPYWKPYEFASYAPGWGKDLTDTTGRFGDSKGWVDQLEGNEKKIFNYDGKVRAMSDMDTIFENATDWLDSIQSKYNNYYIKRGTPETFNTYGKKMNFDRDLLDPSLTKIGVGVLCELPVCSADANGATGFFIITE